VQQHPVVLAFIARHVLAGAVDDARQGYRTTRRELGPLVPPVVVAAALGDFRNEGQRLSGRRVTIRFEETTMMIFDPETRELLRTRPSPLTWDQARALRGARPAGPPPRPSTEPITAQRRASDTGVITVAGQKIALGRIHARQVVTVHVAADTVTIDLGEDTRTVRRTTTQPVRSIKAASPRKAPRVS
jgi:hypothetical protein